VFKDEIKRSMENVPPVTPAPGTTTRDA